MLLGALAETTAPIYDPSQDGDSSVVIGERVYDDSGEIIQELFYQWSAYGEVLAPRIQDDNSTFQAITEWVIRNRPDIVQQRFSHLPNTPYGDMWRAFNGVNAVIDDCIQGDIFYWQGKPMAKVVTGQQGDVADENGVLVHVTPDMVFVPYKVAVMVADYYNSQSGDFITKALDAGAGFWALAAAFGAFAISTALPGMSTSITSAASETVTPFSGYGMSVAETVNPFTGTVTGGMSVPAEFIVGNPLYANPAWLTSGLTVTAADIARSVVQEAAKDATTQTATTTAATTAGTGLTTAQLATYAKMGLTAAGLVAAATGGGSSPTNPYALRPGYTPNQAVLQPGYQNGSVNGNGMMVLGAAALGIFFIMRK